MDKMYTIQKAFIAIIITILIPLTTYSYTSVSGDVSGQTWTSANTYYVTAAATVNTNTILEIEAGTIVKFAPGVYINIRGTMIAVGTSSDPIIFTSRDDDSVGETIAGSDGDPNPGDWSTLYYQGNGGNQGIANMDYCQVLYGGANAVSNTSALYFYYASNGYVTHSSIKHSSQSGVYMTQTSSVTFDQNEVSDNQSHGVIISSGSVDITNCEMSNNGNWPLYIDNCSLMEYAGNSGSGNGYDAISIRGSVDQDLTLSESIAGFPFVITGLITVQKDISLTFLPGEIVKLDGGQVNIRGFLLCEGTQNDPIYFTSFKDDQIGGDWNNDGQLLTEPAPGDWYTFYIQGNSSNQGEAYIDYTEFYYGGANYSNEASMIYFYYATEGSFTNSTVMHSAQNGVRFNFCSGVTVDNLMVANNASNGILSSQASIDFTNCELNNNSNWALNIDNCNLMTYAGNSASGNGYDAIAIHGTVDQDLTISESISGIPFVINGLITVNPNITLTFLPGEIIKLTAGQVNVRGFLMCEGTESEPIYFTSFKDDEIGGDLNNDGNMITDPAPGDWYTFYIQGNSSNQGEAYIDYTEFYYGGANYSNEASMIYFYYATEGSFTNSTVMHSAQNGVRFNFCSGVTVDNLTVANNASNGILSSQASIDFTNCELNNNSNWALNIDNCNLMTYAGNAASGNGYDAIVIKGTVDQDLTISESISGIPFVINGLITVNPNITLTFLPGEIIKLTAGQVNVRGFLMCEGTESEPIYFTSFKDDEIGGDLNNDGNMITDPAPGDWYTFYIQGNSSNQGEAYIDYTEFRYGGANYSNEASMVYYYQTTQGSLTNSKLMYSAQNGVRFNGCSGLTVDNLDVSENNNNGIFNDQSALDFTNSEINNNGGWPIYINNAPIREYAGNSGSGNNVDAILVKGTVDQDITFTSSTIGFPIVINGLVTVNDGVSLTIPAGEIIKLTAGQINVTGSIYCVGSSTEPIIFTSYNDDSHGGDLNGDGNLSTPAPGDWYSVYVNGNSSNDGIGHIEYTQFLYGGQNYNNQNAAIYFYRTDQGYFRHNTIEYSILNGAYIREVTNFEFLDNTVHNCGYSGIYNSNSTFDIVDCVSENNGQHGILLSGSNALSMVEGCQISNNGSWALKAENSSIPEFHGNSGFGNFYNAFGIYGTTAESLEMSKAKCGFPYVILGSLTISTSDTITVPTGEIIKLSDGSITVEGSLLANGHLKNPVVFTSFRDDENGGDLNHDGAVVGPSPGDWQGIYVNGTSSRDGILQFDNCLVTYGGANFNNQYAMLIFNQSHPDCYIKYCTVENSLYHGIRANDSEVKIRSSYIINNTSYGVYTQGSVFPDMGSIISTDGGFNHIMGNNGGDYQIYHNTTADMNAYYNDWGVYSSPQIDNLIYDNEESGNSGRVLFNPWFDPDDPTFYLNVDFTVDFTKIHVGGTVHFTNESDGFPAPDRWEWDFTTNGDVESEATNPYYAYSSEGLKTVCLVVSNGAYSKTLIKEDYINVGNYGAADITSIEDVPDDQGGKVYVHFNKSEFDTSTLVASNEYYTVQLNDGNGWFSAGYSSAFGSPDYTVMTQTPFDSTQFSNGLIDFRVIASMDEGNYTSDVVQGYSVDNISPAVPEGLDAVLTDTVIYLTWNGVPDPDFHYFGIYRSDDPDNFPDEPYTYSAEPELTDTVGTYDFYYYKVTAFDYTGNESDGSNVVETARYIDLNIETGWQGVSTYFNPVDNDVENLFDPVISNIILIQNQSGGVFWPGQNINTLGDWDFLSGYIFKSQAPSLVEGILSTRQDEKELQLHEGWNLIPVLSSNNVGVAELFTDADIEIVKEVAGWKVYWPELNINSMVTVNTGKAYFVLSNADQTILFPDLDGANVLSLPQNNMVNITPWNDPTETPGSHIIGFAPEALTVLKEGDYIGAFTGDELCAGMVYYDGENPALAVFGDDPTTDQEDGFEENEQIHLRVYRPETSETFDLEVTYSLKRTPGNFEAYGLSEVTGMKLSPTSIGEAGSRELEIYPNPSNGIFNLGFGYDNISIYLYDSRGNLIFANDRFQPGRIDLTNQPDGVYYLKVISDNVNEIRKLIKE